MKVTKILEKNAVKIYEATVLDNIYVTRALKYYFTGKHEFLEKGEKLTVGRVDEKGIYELLFTNEATKFNYIINKDNTQVLIYNPNHIRVADIESFNKFLSLNNHRIIETNYSKTLLKNKEQIKNNITTKIYDIETLSGENIRKQFTALNSADKDNVLEKELKAYNAIFDETNNDNDLYSELLFRDLVITSVKNQLSTLLNKICPSKIITTKDVIYGVNNITDYDCLNMSITDIVSVFKQPGILDYTSNTLFDEFFNEYFINAFNKFDYDQTIWSILCTASGYWYSDNNSTQVATAMVRQSLHPNLYNDICDMNCGEIYNMKLLKVSSAKNRLNFSIDIDVTNGNNSNDECYPLSPSVIDLSDIPNINSNDSHYSNLIKCIDNLDKILFIELYSAAKDMLQLYVQGLPSRSRNQNWNDALHRELISSSNYSVFRYRWGAPELVCTNALLWTKYYNFLIYCCDKNRKEYTLDKRYYWMFFNDYLINLYSNDTPTVFFSCICDYDITEEDILVFDDKFIEKLQHKDNSKVYNKFVKTRESLDAFKENYEILSFILRKKMSVRPYITFTKVRDPNLKPINNFTPEILDKLGKFLSVDCDAIVAEEVQYGDEMELTIINTEALKKQVEAGNIKYDIIYKEKKGYYDQSKWILQFKKGNCKFEINIKSIDILDRFAKVLGDVDITTLKAKYILMGGK